MDDMRGTFSEAKLPMCCVTKASLSPLLKKKQALFSLRSGGSTDAVFSSPPPAAPLILAYVVVVN